MRTNVRFWNAGMRDHSIGVRLKRASQISAGVGGLRSCIPHSEAIFRTIFAINHSSTQASVMMSRIVSTVNTPCSSRSGSSRMMGLLRKMARIISLMQLIFWK